MRHLLILFVTLLAFTTACSNAQTTEEAGDATLAPADLTDFEEDLFDVVNQSGYSYDIEIHDGNNRRYVRRLITMNIVNE
ncbi:hypothetical protein B0H94_11267 [Salsuginibacillus halophilus]|uniref:Uncharacterized protein n=1 Tax=Salsuginibacillus halophilus TaxID=517424 RepID=A0A2P8H9U5_9BACI|nr:hypothetical protein [Salsuginibacillus halophilus]PSL42984.1 hypothetical protein B0H94_11267 [Salsuginibacillus halophilus]